MTTNGGVALRLTERLLESAPTRDRLSLTYEQRSRSRLRARLDDGREVGVLLPRGGETLRDGDLLSDGQGRVVQVRAAPERVSSASSADPVLLARAAYHLGNRHVAVQIVPGRLYWLRDHVLDAMVCGLGLAVVAEEAPFEPEPGAYGRRPHGHASERHETASHQGHERDHPHTHGQGHGHDDHPGHGNEHDP